VCCQIPRDGNKDLLALVAIVPLVKLPHARLEHFVGVKTGIFTEESMCERHDQCFGWVTEDEMASNEASRSTDLLLAVRCVEQRGADFLWRDRQAIGILSRVGWFAAGQLNSSF
jgi:hypothetical protein